MDAQGEYHAPDSALERAACRWGEADVLPGGDAYVPGMGEPLVKGQMLASDSGTQVATGKVQPIRSTIRAWWSGSNGQDPA